VNGKLANDYIISLINCGKDAYVCHLSIRKLDRLRLRRSKLEVGIYQMLVRSEAGGGRLHDEKAIGTEHTETERRRDKRQKEL